MLVRREAVLSAGGDEQRHAFAERGRAALDLEHTAPLEHDVHLVLVVGLLPVGFRGDEHVDPDLEPRRLVHHLVTAATLDQRPVGRGNVERMGGSGHGQGESSSSLDASPPSEPMTAVQCVAVATRILIVDDHPVVRTGLRLLLERESDMEVVGEAGDGDDGVRAARLEKPDVVLLDVVMPGRSGLDACADVIAASKAKVLMLSMQDDPSYVREAFGAGASGYMLKEAADTELVQAVREVASGGRYVHPTLGARLAQAEVEAARRAASDPLSEREREVLRLLALGHTNQEIAKKLFISVRTAETHRAHIMQKLGLATRAELVRYALVNGLLDEA